MSLPFILFLLVFGLLACQPEQEKQASKPSPTPTATLIPPTPTPTLDPNITPSPVPCVPNPEWQDTYTVRQGDTLGAIAYASGVSTEALQRGNCLKNPDDLDIGDVLRVPNAIAVDLVFSVQGIEGAIVFVRTAEDGSHDLWTVKSDGAALRQISEQGAVLGRAVRTSDYEVIAYRVASDYHYSAGDPLHDDLPSDIWLMAADGTSIFQLIDQGPRDELVRSQPVWSADNQRLLYIEQAYDRGALVTINRDATGRSVLATGEFTPPQTALPLPPAWSPDGTQIAYITWAGNRPFLNILDFETRQAQVYDEGFLYRQGPYWVPQNGLMGKPVLAYQVEEGGVLVWKIVDPATGTIEQRDGDLAMLAPDVGWYIRTEGDTLHLYDIVNTPQEHPLPAQMAEFSWGAIAGQYVFVTEEGLKRIDMTTNNERLITTGQDTLPVWTEPLWLILP